MSQEKRPVKYSVVVPVCNEEKGLEGFVLELEKNMEFLKGEYEIILVDDGSTDDTWKIIEAANRKNKRFRGIGLTRNFGHQHAIMAGLAKTAGEAVAIMDGDGQDTPQVLRQLFEKWAEGFDVVYAIRRRRKGNVFKRLSYFFFYRILNFMVSFRMPLDAGDFSVMSRKVVDFIVKQKEQNPYIRGLRSWWGGRQVGIKYERPQRFEGISKYSYGKLFILALQGIISFSRVPLRVATFIGMIISLAGISYGLFNIVRKLVFGLQYPGYTSIIVAVTFIGGLHIFLLGVIGEYIGNIFEDIRNKPQFVISREI